RAGTRCRAGRGGPAGTAGRPGTRARRGRRAAARSGRSRPAEAPPLRLVVEEVTGRGQGDLPLFLSDRLARGGVWRGDPALRVAPAQGGVHPAAPARIRCSTTAPSPRAPR